LYFRLLYLKPTTMSNVRNDFGPKEALLSALHVVATFIFLFLINLGFAWVVNHILLNLFEWFNGISLFWKLMLLLLGGFIIVELVIGLSSMVAAFLGTLLYSKLPANNFTTFTGGFLILIGFIWTMYDIWTLPIHFSFWIIVELIVVSGFAYSLYYMVFMTIKKTPAITD
jgi:hypothetical protein